jgi:hypothetical protein
MSTSNTRAKHLSSLVGKIVMALAFAAVIGSLSIAPALGQDHERRQGQQEQGRYERERHDERGWRARGRHDRRHWRTYQSYRYAAPFYTRPPVIYTPPPVVYNPYPYQSPGISIVLPFRFR